MRTTQDQWDYLAKKTQHASRLLGSKTWQDVRLKASYNRIRLKPDWGRLVFATICLVMGAFFILFALVAKEHSLPPFILAMTFALILFIGVFLSPHFIKNICWDIYGYEIKITYGYSFIRRTLYVKRDCLKVSFAVCDKDVRGTNIRKGFSMLSLERTDEIRPELLIAVSVRKSSLNLAFQKLSEFLKCEGTDATLIEVELLGGGTITIPKTALADNAHITADSKILDFPDDNLAIYTRKRGVGFLYFFATLGALLIGLGCLFLTKNHFLVRIPFILFAVGFCFMSGCAFFSFFKTRYTVADKLNDSLTVKASMRPSCKERLLCRLSEIGAIQMCRYGSVIPTGKSTRDITVYELNVILKESGTKRLNLHRSFSESQLRNDAFRFAEFLGVPLLDHT